MSYAGAIVYNNLSQLLKVTPHIDRFKRDCFVHFSNDKAKYVLYIPYLYIYFLTLSNIKMDNLRALSLSERRDITVAILNDVQYNGVTSSPTVTTPSKTQQNVEMEHVFYINETVHFGDSTD